MAIVCTDQDVDLNTFKMDAIIGIQTITIMERIDTVEVSTRNLQITQQNFKLYVE